MAKDHIDHIPLAYPCFVGKPDDHPLGKLFDFYEFSLLWIPFEKGMSCKINGDESRMFTTKTNRYLPVVLHDSITYPPACSGSSILVDRDALLLGVLLGRAFAEEHELLEFITDGYCRRLLTLLKEVSFGFKVHDFIKTYFVQESWLGNSISLLGKLLALESACILFPRDNYLLFYYLCMLWEIAEQLEEDLIGTYLETIVATGMTVDWKTLQPEFADILSYIFCASLTCTGRRADPADREWYKTVFKYVPNNTGLQMKLAMTRLSTQGESIHSFRFMGEDSAVPVIFTSVNPYEAMQTPARDYRPTVSSYDELLFQIMTAAHREALYAWYTDQGLQHFISNGGGGKNYSTLKQLLPKAQAEQILAWLAHNPADIDLAVLWKLRKELMKYPLGVNVSCGAYTAMMRMNYQYIAYCLGGESKATAYFDSLLTNEQWLEAERCSTRCQNISRSISYFDRKAMTELYIFQRRNSLFAVPFMAWGTTISIPDYHFERQGPSGILCRDDKACGALIGGALGDVLGSHYKHTTRQKPLTWFLERDEPYACPTTHTENSRLTILLADSIVRNKGFVAEKYAQQLERDHFRAKGKVLRKFIKNYRQGDAWYQSSVSSAGNSAAVRVAPVGLAYRYNPKGLKLAAGLQAQITHDDPMAIASSIVMASATAILLNMNTEKLESVEAKTAFCRTVASCIEGIEGEKEYRTRNTGEVSSIYQRIMIDIPKFLQEERSIEAVQEIFWSGAYSLESVPFALFCFLSYPNDFERVLFHAVNCSRDSSSVAAMACTLAGAFNGLQSSLQQLGAEKYIQPAMRSNGDYLTGIEEHEALLKVAKMLV